MIGIERLIAMRRIRWALWLASIPLMAQFYVVWALGYLNLQPNLYRYTVLHASAVLFTAGLILALTPVIMNQVREAVRDRYYATTLLLYLAVTYELAYLASVPPYYSLSLGASLDTATYLQSFASMTYYRQFLVNFVGSFLGVHASPILLLIYPIYLAYPSIQWLMAIQTIILTLPIPLMYRLGMKLFNNGKYALATAMLYALYPWITIASYAAFEVVTLAGAFMALTLVSMYIRDYKTYWASLTLAMASVEYVPLFGIGLAIYQATMREYRKWAILTLVYSMAWLIADYYLVMYFSHGTHSIFANLYGSALSALLTQITSRILHYGTAKTTHDPGLGSYLSSITQQALSQLNLKIEYLIMTLGPLLFLNLAEPQSILLMPWLASLLTNFTPYYIPSIYYTIFIGSAALPSALWALRKLNESSRKKTLIALLIINVLMAIFMGSLTPVSGLYYGNSIPNWAQPTTNQYDMAMIELAKYIPWNATVAVPATAVPWYSITRYAFMVPFFGPTQGTEYVVYSPLVPTGYPYSTGGPEYKPYIFNDGTWILKANYTGPVEVMGGFTYEETYVINPILPMTYQYQITTLPPTNLTITVNATLINQSYITTVNEALLNTQLQLPQGIACGIGPGEIGIPGGTYIAQPIMLNKTMTITTITTFTSYAMNLATAEIAITTQPTLTQEDTLYTYSFGAPWWCLPHSWATPITVKPGITLKPGRYYVILTFPVQGQTICEGAPGMPKALLINATTNQVIRQLPCTLGMVITTPGNGNDNDYDVNITVSILNTILTVTTNETLTINTQINQQSPITLTITPQKPLLNKQLILTINIKTNDATKEPTIPWYTVPAIALIPEYLLLISAIALQTRGRTKMTPITSDQVTSLPYVVKNHQ